MPGYKKCVVKDCGLSRHSKVSGVKFFSFPKFKEGNDHNKREGDILKERRSVWLWRTRISEHQLLENPSFAVCSKHFVLGKPSYALDINSMDWAPTQFLEKGYVTAASVKRFNRMKEPMKHQHQVYFKSKSTRKRKITRAKQQCVQEPLNQECLNQEPLNVHNDSTEMLTIDETVEVDAPDSELILETDTSTTTMVLELEVDSRNTSKSSGGCDSQEDDTSRSLLSEEEQDSPEKALEKIILDLKAKLFESEKKAQDLIKKLESVEVENLKLKSELAEKSQDPLFTKK